jgi:hypothetical protein
MSRIKEENKLFEMKIKTYYKGTLIKEKNIHDQSATVTLTGQ